MTQDVSVSPSTERAAPATAGAMPPHAIQLDAMQQLLDAMIAVRDGDFSVRLPPHWEGLDGKLADTFNEIVAANRRLAEDLSRVSMQVWVAKARPARA